MNQNFRVADDVVSGVEIENGFRNHDVSPSDPVQEPGEVFELP